jgi:hypothetical protein
MSRLGPSVIDALVSVDGVPCTYAVVRRAGRWTRCAIACCSAVLLVPVCDLSRIPTCVGAPFVDMLHTATYCRLDRNGATAQPIASSVLAVAMQGGKQRSGSTLEDNGSDTMF